MYEVSYGCIIHVYKIKILTRLEKYHINIGNIIIDQKVEVMKIQFSSSDR
jgi:hypothetical protein